MCKFRNLFHLKKYIMFMCPICTPIRFSEEFEKKCKQRISIFFKVSWLVVIPIILTALICGLIYKEITRRPYVTLWSKEEVSKSTSLIYV